MEWERVVFKIKIEIILNLYINIKKKKKFAIFMDGILVIKDKRYKDSSSKNLYFNLSRKKKTF